MEFFFFFLLLFFFFFDIIADRDDSRGKEEKTSVGAEGTVTRGSKGITLDIVRYRYIFDQILVWFWWRKIFCNRIGNFPQIAPVKLACQIHF